MKKLKAAEKIKSRRENFSIGIFFLFVGFVIGNLFGTFLPAIRIFFSWDGFLVLFLLFFIEFISYIRYQRKSRFFLILWNFRKGKRVWKKNLRKQNGNKTRGNFPFFSLSFIPLFSNEVPTEGSLPFFNFFLIFSTFFIKKVEKIKSRAASPLRNLNYFKIGFLLGFFIDAYKVGS